MELIDRIKKDIDERLEELRPQIEEIPRLEAALAALDATSDARGGGGERRTGGRPRGRSAGSGSGTRRRGSGRRARRGQRREELLQLLRGNPEISVAEAARQMGVSAPQVSTLLRRLREEGTVERAEGRFVVSEETAFSERGDDAVDGGEADAGRPDEPAGDGALEGGGGSGGDPVAGIEGPGVEALAAPEGGDEVTDAPEAARDEAGRPQAT